MNTTPYDSMTTEQFMVEVAKREQLVDKTDEEIIEALALYLIRAFSDEETLLAYYTSDVPKSYQQRLLAINPEKIASKFKEYGLLDTLTTRAEMIIK